MVRLAKRPRGGQTAVMRLLETPFARAVISVVFALGMVGFVIFVVPSTSCKLTCVTETSYGPAAISAAVALLAGTLLFARHLRKSRTGRT